MNRMTFMLLVFSMNSYGFCFDEAGRTFDISPSLLKAIAYTESRLDPNAINTSNKNGTIDYGLMQINSSWFSQLADFGVLENSVINEPCINVHVGAWILAQNMAQTGDNWLAVGAYNAGYRKSRQQARERYIALVKRNLMELKK
ncbi:lytic transglycosylase domain-containing protein [Vibrio mediterranei]|uniref:lytic transglycosylase domain-containing protein n=1 Tax=Vibrio mediterranei TaxID=689 RepID=UPI004068D212